LALFSYVRVSEGGLTFRKPEIWSDEATIVLSGASHPEWRSVLPPTAQPDRFTSLVDLYAELATGDDVMASLRKQGLLRPGAGSLGAGAITATAVHSTFNGTPTPLLKITAMGISPAAARQLAIAATDAFINVVELRQTAANIPQGQRVELRIVKRSGVPMLIQPRSKTTLIIIFLAGLTVTFAAAFIRDNSQRSANRETRPEPATVLDPFQRPGETAVLAESELHAAGEQAARSETHEASGESDVGSVTRARWSARSSG
jgi:hypothetical protein